MNEGSCSGSIARIAPIRSDSGADRQHLAFIDPIVEIS